MLPQNVPLGCSWKHLSKNLKAVRERTTGFIEGWALQAEGGSQGPEAEGAQEAGGAGLEESGGREVTQKWPLMLWLSNQWKAGNTKADEGQNTGEYLLRELAEKKEPGKALSETEGEQKGGQQGPGLLPLTVTSAEASNSDSRRGGRKAPERSGVEAWLGQNATELGEISASGMLYLFPCRHSTGGKV